MKIKLGEKMGESAVSPPKGSEMYYPTIRISKKAGGYTAGDDFKAEITGTIKSVTHGDDDKHECVLEVHDINFKNGSGRDLPTGAEAMDGFMKRQKNQASKKDKPPYPEDE